MAVERSIVIEHRITTHHGDFDVRYWIESEAAYGGVDRPTAMEQIRAAETVVTLKLPHLEMATTLLHDVPSANSVEAVSRNGMGTAVHRDWP
jgi:hypothetical protein